MSIAVNAVGALVLGVALVTVQTSTATARQFDTWELYRKGSEGVVIKETRSEYRIAEISFKYGGYAANCFRGRLSGNGDYPIHGVNWIMTNGDPAAAVARKRVRLIGATNGKRMFADFKGANGQYWRTIYGSLADTGGSVKRLWHRTCVRPFLSEGQGPWGR